jgi:hypothetical protein
LLDKNRENLFNISKEGKGIRHWLNNISLKSHNEIASKGVQFAKKNMWKLNLSHASGLAYSTIVLGVLLPKLNILINGARSKKAQKPVQILDKPLNQAISMEGFMNLKGKTALQK